MKTGARNWKDRKFERQNFWHQKKHTKLHSDLVQGLKGRAIEFLAKRVLLSASSGPRQRAGKRMKVHVISASPDDHGLTHSTALAYCSSKWRFISVSGYGKDCYTTVIYTYISADISVLCMYILYVAIPFTLPFLAFLRTKCRGTVD